MGILKNIAKRMVLLVLEQLVRWRLHKIKPEIVGVTGSVGKTSTKDAIFMAVSPNIPSQCSQKSYNSEFGALLAILEEGSGYSSLFKWAETIGKAFFSTLLMKDAPYKKFILEMGVNTPGDMDYLVKHAPPKIGVFSNVKAMHLAEGQFKDLEAIFEEKSKMIRAIPKEGWAILNSDDARVMAVKDDVDCHVITFGTSPLADLRATQIRSLANGLSFSLTYETTTHELHFPNLLGKHQVYVLLPAFAVGFLMGISFEKLYEALKDFAPPPGRMNRIEGMKESVIIDSSYNASPEAMIVALEILGKMPGRHIAALGSINELGDYSEKEHQRVGKHIPANADMLVTVGENAKLYAESASESGLSEDKIHSFETSKAAAEFLKSKVQKGDAILAKGSQNNVRMEHLVKALMAHPEQAEKLLVRQEAYWINH